MKGIQGLVIAVLLGTIGAVFNLVYLNKNRNVDPLYFIGIKSNTRVERGEPIKRVS